MTGPSCRKSRLVCISDTHCNMFWWLSPNLNCVFENLFCVLFWLYVFFPNVSIPNDSIPTMSFSQIPWSRIVNPLPLPKGISWIVRPRRFTIQIAIWDWIGGIDVFWDWCIREKDIVSFFLAGTCFAFFCKNKNKNLWMKFLKARACYVLLARNRWR